jgi:HEAT repeat protein
LGALGPAAVTPLLNALRREAEPTRAEALARALVTAGGKDALGPLQAMTLENDRQAKANAVLGLGLLGDPATLDTLKQAADAGIGTAPLALARLGAPGLQALLARLDHPKEFQRRLAAAALAQAREPSLVPLLEGGLQGESAVVADASARALAEMAGWATSTGVPADASLQALASAALERAQARGDTRALALGVERLLRRDLGEDDLIETMEMHGDERLAGAFLRSSSERLRLVAGEWARQTQRTPCAARLDAIDCTVAAADATTAP